jgi:hypothetical protein
VTYAGCLVGRACGTWVSSTWFVLCDLCRLSGGASVWHLGKLYLVGGYTVEYDVELKSFYQGGSVLCYRFCTSLTLRM